MGGLIVTRTLERQAIDHSAHMAVRRDKLLQIFSGQIEAGMASEQSHFLGSRRGIRHDKSPVAKRARCQLLGLGER
jgi:hypothetical protein